jgi:uncharacterized protein YjdB
MRLFRAILVGLCGLIAVGCGDGGVQSPDFTPELQAIAVVPTSASVAAGRTVQFTAMGTWTLPPGSGAATEQRPVGSAEWHVSNANASIDENGLATGLVIGSSQITASADGHESDPADLTITAAELESIAITPDNPTISLGNSQVLQATGTFSDGTTAPVSVNWVSSNTGAATVAPASGTSTTAQSVATGSTTITGSTTYTPSGGTTPITVEDSVVLTVGPFQPTLASITVSPDSATQPLGRPQQFAADGQCTTAPFSPTLAPCNPADVGATITWSVGTPSIATIDAQGVAVGQAVGSTTVIATSGTITDSATFTVTQAVVTDLIVAPATASIAAGGSQVFTATAVFSDGATGPIQVDWASSAPAVATVAPATDSAQTTATGLTVGTTTITASTTNTLGEPVDGTATLDVTGVTLTDLLRVETAAGEPQGRVAPGRAVEFIAIGRFSDNTEAPIDDSNITWTSGSTAIATVDADGFATGVAKGQTDITAMRVDQPTDTASAPLTVTDPVCTTELLASDGATVVPFTTPLCVGCTVSNEGNIINANPDDFGLVSTTVGLIGAEAGVTASPANVNPPYTVPFGAGNNAGFVIGKPLGTLLTAEVLSQVFVSTLLDGVVQESTSTGVTPLRLDLLGVNLVGASETALVSFKTSLPYDAIQLTVNSGTASALSNVQVYQACATAEPPVPAATLVGVSRVAPATANVTAGATASFTAYGTYSDGTEAPLSDADIDWSSSNSGVASVNANGVVTGVAAGSANITATLKTDVTSSGANRSSQAVVTVLGNLCATPILASEGASVTEETNLLCLLCSVSNTPNIIDASSTTYGTIHVPLGLLGVLELGNASVTASSNSATPFPGSGSAGFLISRPVGQLLEAELLSQIQVSTLLDDVVQQSTGVQIPLRADLLGISLTGGAGGTALVSIAPTLPYNALRLKFNSGIVTAGILENVLQTVNVYQACSSVTLPPAP